MVCRELLLVLGSGPGELPGKTHLAWPKLTLSYQGGGKRNPLVPGALGTCPPPSLVLLRLWKGL